MAANHLTLPDLTPKQIARFWRKVKKGSGDTCWPWMGTRNKAGHGQVRIDGRNYYVHRIAYLLAHGRFAPELCVMHRCDNPPCCNPADLRLGTHGDNTQDMMRKGRCSRAGGPSGEGHWSQIYPGRVLRGESHGSAKLTADDVRDIRRRYAAGGVTYRALAAEYAVVVATITHILRRKTWKHVF